jgi:serine phosphatase RsbU (regulator of sigma subunit)
MLTNEETATVLTDSRPRVLIADDQPDVLNALRLLLREEAFDADTAASVQEIRAKLAASTYDLLLMDLNYARDTTSGGEGLELLGEVHQHDPLLPVVVMTGWGSIETAVEAMRRGARTFVHKPWENGALSSTLRREVEHGRAARRAHRQEMREESEAQAIQRALLPALDTVLPRCDIAARWTPAAAFGGDFCHVLQLGEERVALWIGDVCGKGLPAALLMAHVQASLRALAAEDLSVRTVAVRLNRQLAANQELGRFVTLFYAVYDMARGQLAFTNAGHNPPVVARADGSVTRLTEGGTVLGMFEDAAYAEQVVDLRAGDRLTLFTDGLSDPDAGDDEFGDEHLVQAIVRRRSAPASEIADEVLNEIASRHGGHLDDDATIVVAAIR